MKLRFSLRVLILLVTAIGLFLGYSQYRRREILKVCEKYEIDGFVISTPHERRDFFWQRYPIVGVVHLVDGKEVLTTQNRWAGKVIPTTTRNSRVIEEYKGLGIVRYE